MSLTKYQQQINSDFPFYFAYANNPVYYTAISTSALTSSDFYYNFRTFINTQDGSTSGEQVSTNKIYPTITDGLGIYNPMSLLRRYVYEPWFSPDVRTWTFPQTIRNIRIDVSETTDSGSTTLYNKGFIISGNEMMSVNEYRNDGINPEHYILEDETSRLFSRQEGFTNKLNVNERCTLRCIQGKMVYDDPTLLSKLENIRIEVTKSNGNMFRYSFISDNSEHEWWSDTAQYSSDNTELQILTGMIVDIPVGPWNLIQNGYTGSAWTNKYIMTGYNYGAGWVNTSVLTTGENILEVGDTYTIETMGDVSITSKKYYFEVSCDSKYTPMQLAWENELGGFDYYSFKKVSEFSEVSEKTYYEKKRDTIGANPYLGSYDNTHKSEDKGIVTLGIETNETIMINTDWLKDVELLYLRDLIKSRNIYILDESKDGARPYGSTEIITPGRWYSIILDTDSITYKTNKKGLKQFNMTVIKNTSKK